MSAHQTADPQVLVPTSVERVQFHDGQLVDADTLTTATMFPVSLLQLVLRSFLGCGIVCGLDVVRTDEERPCVRIRPGVVIDCHGYPVELCREVVLDLTPDPSTCETGPRTLGIVVRRATSEDAPRRRCGCGGSGGTPHDCDRVRDQVLVKAIDLERLDPVRDHLCSTPPSDPGGGHDSGPELPGAAGPTAAPGGAGAEHPDCACLMGCAERCCAERSWVLLAQVTVSPADDHGSATGYTLGEVDLGGRRYVKPIECCRSRHRAEPAPEATGSQPPEGPSTPAPPAPVT